MTDSLKNQDERFNDAYNNVCELVADFSNNIEFYLRKDYSEYDVRNDYINKFFIALGWDVQHNIQKNPRKQEVKVEKNLLIKGRQRRADYYFSSEPNYGSVKFFVEAKKPSPHLENKDDYFQTLRYGWNAGVPISILTNFNDFIVLDCRRKPDIDNALNTALHKYHFRDYANEERFAQIYYLFSRDSVKDGSIEEYALELPAPKSKIIQRGLFPGAYTPVNDSFLADLDEYRISLARGAILNDPELDSDTLTSIVQWALDRIIFIRFLEDKGIEPDYIISMFGSSGKIWADFIAQSKRLNKIYNGVVFKKHIIDRKEFKGINGQVFMDVCEEIAHINTPYDFNFIPVHILGSIYERYLGRTIIKDNGSLKLEDKPEVKKAGGVYYTHQYIVKYIIERTVGSKLQGKTPHEVAKLKFADISCGSGSFLISVFDRILEHYKNWYSDNPKVAEAEGFEFRDGEWIIPLDVKRNILINNIYGVDIDPHAIEVTQLSLSLKLLEEETIGTTHDIARKEKVLPDLSKNIICGNSLIEYKPLDDLFSTDDLKHIKPLNFISVFPKVIDGGGFDAIVGNPPYGAELTQKERVYLDKDYQFGTTDSAALFMVQQHRLLKNGGIGGFIVPKPFTYASNWRHVREYLLGDLIEIVDCGKAWTNVKLEQVIYITKKGASDKKYSIGIRKNSNIESIGSIEKLLVKKYGFIINGVSRKEIDIAHKIRERCSFLGDLIVNKRGAPLQKYITKKRNDLGVIGGKQIKRYGIELHPRGYINEKNIIDEKAYIRPNSILVQNIVAHITKPTDHILLIATTTNHVSDPCVIIDTVNQLQNISTFEIDYILGILNSRIISWYVYRFVFAKAIRTMHFDAPVTNRVPVPSINLNEDKGRSTHDDISELVKARNRLEFEISTTIDEYELETLKKEIDTIERDIDYRVGRAFGLHDNEIKMITGLGG